MKSVKTLYTLIISGAVFFANCSGEPIKKVFEYASSAPSYSTPLIINEYVIFGNEAGTITAVNKMTGQSVWRYETYKSVISAPKFGEDLVFFGSENYSFYAINMRGEEVWKYATRSAIKSDPLYHDGKVYFSSYDGNLYCVTAKKRKLVWIFPAPTPPKEEEDKPEGDKTAVKDKGTKDKKEGEVEQKEPVPPPIVPGNFSYSAPVLSNGVIFIGNLDGYLYAVNAADGTLKWRFKTDSGVTSTPLVRNGVVYFGSNDTYVYAIDEATGTKVHWKFKTGGWVNSSPKLKDGVIYVGSVDKNLYAIDAQSGKEVCRYAAKGEIIAYPEFAQGLVFFAGGTNDGQIYAVEEKTCKEVWKFITGYQIKSDPVIDGDMLYITSGDRKLYAFKIKYKK
ncbi:MAG: hypothetical protein Kow0090_20380 [Myxococcota bacterium]